MSSSTVPAAATSAIKAHLHRGDITADRVIASLRAYHALRVHSDGEGDGGVGEGTGRAKRRRSTSSRGDGAMTGLELKAYVPCVVKFLRHKRDRMIEWHLFDSLALYCRFCCQTQ